MFLVGQLRTFFADLQDPDYLSAIALVHSRFSTNTNPSMPKAPDCRAANNPWPEWLRICKTDYGQEEAIAVYWSAFSIFVLLL